jgi:hypothetical protein
LNYVDAGQKGDPAFVGPNLKNQPAMMSEDLAANIAATRDFLHGCFSIQPTQDEYEAMLAFNMMVPPKVRLALQPGRCRTRSRNRPSFTFSIPSRRWCQDRNYRQAATPCASPGLTAARKS